MAHWDRRELNKLVAEHPDDYKKRFPEPFSAMIPEDASSENKLATEAYVNEHTVKYTEQTLTAEQKAQALANIGAASEEEVSALADQKYEGPYATDGDLPAASASTMGAIYLVGPDANDEYERKVTKLSGSTYSWVSLGMTSVNLANYTTKTEFIQLEAKVGGIDDELEMTTVVTPLTRDDRVSKLAINASGQIITNSLTSYVIDYLVATQTMTIKVTETISGPSSSVGMFGYVDSVADIVAGTTITAKDGIYTTSGSFEGEIVVPSGKVFVISTQTSKATYSISAIEEKSARLESYDPVVGGERIFSGDLRNFCPVVNYGIKSATGAKDYRAGWNSSDFIRVKGGSTLKYKCYSAQSYGIAFYADNTPDSYISGETATGSELTISVPATAKFFRASAYASNATQTIEFAQEELGFTQVRTLVETLYADYEGALEQNPFDGKAVIPSGQKILGIGASFMRGNATGEGNNNVWLHLLGSKVGCEVINDGVGGTNVMYHANRLFNGSILGNGTAPISDVSAILIMHTHNKDVFTLPEPFASYSVSDYETNVLPFATTSGDSPLDVEYAKAFDYIIKKTKSLFYADKSETEYASGVQTYVGQYYFKPFQIVLCTHWHDARTIYNASVRKLAKKWGIPLVRFDDKIGFTRKKVNPAFGYQPSLEFVGNVGGASPYETIDGVAYGWHPMCGGTDVYIQQKLASIAKDSFDYFPA